MTPTLTQRLQRAVALRNAINRWHSDAQVDMVLSKDHPLSIARYKDEMALYNAAPSIVQLAVELGAECEALRADAERYRWLRDESDWEISEAGASMQDWEPDEMDAAIDAAMAKDSPNAQ